MNKLLVLFTMLCYGNRRYKARDRATPMNVQTLLSAINENQLLKGVVGGTAPVAGAALSLLQSIEIGLRIASLGIGCMVGIATFISLVRSIRKDKRK